MSGHGSAVLGSARGSRAGEGGPCSRTSFRMTAFFRRIFPRNSFRRAAETSTRAACAPQITAERSMHP